MDIFTVHRETEAKPKILEDLEDLWKDFSISETVSKANKRKISISLSYKR